MTSPTPFFVLLSIFLILHLSNQHVNCHLIPPKIIGSNGRNPSGLTENLISCGGSFCDPMFCKKTSNEGESLYECIRGSD